MKNSYLKILFASALVLVSSQAMVSADPTTKAALGTPAATDTKNQINTPAGPASQMTSHPNSATKNDGTTACPSTASQTTAAGDKATKMPQKETAPSTSNQ